MKKSEMPIHPIRGADGTICRNDGCLDQSKDVPLIGLTKREYFAGLAMQGMCSFHGTFGQGNNLLAVAERSVMMADELLNQLND